MRVIRIFLLLAAFPSFVLAQEENRPEYIKECQNTEYQVSVNIPQLYSAGDMEEANKLFQYWKTNCNPSAAMFYIGFILDIKTHGAIQNISDKEFVELIIEHDYSKALYRPRFGYYYQSYYNDPNNSDVAEKLHYFIHHSISNLRLSDFDSNSREYLLIQSVNGNREQVAKFLQRKNEKYPDLRIQYNQLVGQSINQSSMVWSVRAGQWIPQGDAAKIGPLFNIGGTVGGMTNKGDIISIAIEGRTGSGVRDSIQIRYEDSLQYTDFASGFYVGLEFDKKLWQSPNHRHRIGGVIGLGYDYLNIIPEKYREVEDGDTEDDIRINPRKYISTINVNVGANYQYRMTNHVAVGAYGRYNYTNYLNRGGDPINGDNYTVQLFVSVYLNSENNFEIF